MQFLECPPLFTRLPRELRSMIYKLVYAPCQTPWIHLYSEYDHDKREDVLRRRTSPDLRGALSLNRICRVVHAETQNHLPLLLEQPTFTISLLTHADDHIYTSFRESHIGNFSQETPTDEFSDSPLLHYIPLPSHNITFLRLYFKMYGVHWSHIQDLKIFFPSLQNLHIDVRAPSVVSNRYTSLQQGHHGYQSAEDFYWGRAILRSFLSDLSIYVAVSGGCRDYVGEHIGGLALVAAHLKHIDTKTDDWELQYADRNCRLGGNRRWRLESVTGDSGRECITWVQSVV